MRFFQQLGKLLHTKRRRGIDGIFSRDEFNFIIERERARCDRGGDGFALIEIEPASPLGANSSTDCLIRIVRKRIRLTDDIGTLDDDRIGVLLPETALDGARVLAESIRLLALDASQKFTYAISVYPDIRGKALDKRATTRNNRKKSRPKSNANFCAAETIIPDRKGSDITPDFDFVVTKKSPLWKRAMDICGAVIFLILLSPVMLTVAILVKVTSSGPVLFRQPRAGIGGVPFTVYKFRSMITGADHRKATLLQYNEWQGPVFKMAQDPRVTPVGRFLRQWSLDELPQFVNVLTGDMSLVGPRPLPLEEVSNRSWQDMRLQIKPGITCLWQVYARHTRNFEEWVRLDIRYARTYTFLLDLKILLLTLPAVLSRRGAY